jgi:hypothetical protein
LCLYSDISKSGYDQWTNFSSENPITLNANEYGYPTERTSGYPRRIISMPGATDFAPRSFPLHPYGKVRVMWDGNRDIQLTFTPRGGYSFADGFSSTNTEVLAKRSLTGTTNNVKVFDFSAYSEERDSTGERNDSPFIQILINPDPIDLQNPTLSNLRVYTQDVLDSNGDFLPGEPRLYRPYAYEMLAGMKVIRSMQAFNRPVSSVGDICTSQHMSYPPYYRYGRKKVSRIEPYISEGSPWSRFPSTQSRRGPLIKLTTQQPHGFSEGSFCYSEKANQNFIFDYTVNTTSGQSTFGGFGVYCHVLSPTELVITAYTENGATFSPIDDPDFYLVKIDGCMPVSDFFTMVNIADDECAAWLNIPLFADQDIVEHFAEQAASTLAPGRQVYIEYTNEPWNPGLSAPSLFCWAILGEDLFNETASYAVAIRYYAIRSEMIRYWFSQKWSALGRTEDVTLVLGGWVSIPSFAAGLLDAGRDYDRNGVHKNAQGFIGPCFMEPTAIAFTAYWGGISGCNLDLSVAESLKRDRHEDVLDGLMYYIGDNFIYKYTRDNKAAIAAHDHPNSENIQIFGYEGGPAYLGIKDNGLSSNDKLNSVASFWHPRMADRMSFLFNEVSKPEYGFKNLCIYTGWGGYTPEAGAVGATLPKLYGVTKAHGMIFGEGLENEAEITDQNGFPVAPYLTEVESTVGHSLRRWNSHVPPEESHPNYSEDDVDVIERQVGDSTYPIVFKLRDSSNLLLGKTGASPSCVVSKNGSAFASCSGTVSEISSGYYKIHGAGLGTDIGSIGQANIEVTATGAVPKSIIVNVVDHNPFIGIESFRSGTAQAGSSTTITLESSTTSFTLPATGGKAFITVVDGTGVGQCAPISSIDWNTLVATIQGSFVTNPDSTSKYMIFISSYENVTVGGYATGQAPLQPTVSGRTLDVTATGCAGVDWANVEGQGSTVGLSGTTVKAIADPVEMATDFEIEAGIDFLKAMRAITAATSGLLSGAGTGTITIKGAGVSDTRIVATTDVNGNRTAITLSL